MAQDKYTAIWVSHSSISDYLRCPRAYFLRNVYRDPKTNHKISLVQPALTLGQVVHEVVESLSLLPVAQRFSTPLVRRFEDAWKNVTGRKGGFTSSTQEEGFKQRGLSMMERIAEHPGILEHKAVKIRQELPYYWLSEEDNIILCGKIDWLTYDEEKDAVEVVDFKTGKYDEDPESLQLPIYFLLATHCQTRPVLGLKYWYLDRDSEPVSVAIPTGEDAQKRVLELAKRVQLARKLERFVCPKKDGCSACKPYEAIIAGVASKVGVNSYGQDLYVLPLEEENSEIPQ